MHKHPERVQEFKQSFGTVTVFYPEATRERCTVALRLNLDPVRLARSRAKNAPHSPQGEQQHGSRPENLRRLGTRRLVVVDDIGLLPVAADAAEGLYRLIDAASNDSHLNHPYNREISSSYA
ncbi:MAG: hypothetical protein WAW88_11515 [Nocardioides sp.]